MFNMFFYFLTVAIYYTNVFCHHQARVQRVHVDGLARTKDDLVINTVRDVFTAQDFQSVSLWEISGGVLVSSDYTLLCFRYSIGMIEWAYRRAIEYSFLYQKFSTSLLSIFKTSLFENALVQLDLALICKGLLNCTILYYYRASYGYHRRASIDIQ